MSIATLLWGLQLAAAGAAPPTSATPKAGSEAADQIVYERRLAQRGSYDETMEAVRSSPRARPLARADRPLLSNAAMTRARDYALANNSKAMLVWYDGRLQQDAYGPLSGPSTLIASGSMAKPLGAIMVGRAIQLGAILSLDQPAVDFITEWRDTPKAAITIRQLLNMTSGLLEQGFNDDPNSIWNRVYLHPRHDRILINEYPLSAVPGARYQYSNASAELIGIIIERATKKRYAAFVSETLVKPLGATGGEVWLDRPEGVAHTGCCMMLPAETWLRFGLLLMNDGVWQGERLLPRGYVAAMRTPTLSNPRYGLGLWLPGDYVRFRGFGRPDQVDAGQVLHSEPYLEKDLFLFDGNLNQVLYMMPSRRLAILRMGTAPPKATSANLGWDNSLLPNLVLRDLDRDTRPRR